MELICYVESVEAERTFKGRDGREVKAKEVILVDGLNRYAATAFDRTAEKEFEVTHYYKVSLSFDIRKTTDGKIFQSIIMNNAAKLW